MSETSYLICAHCGEPAPLKNAEPPTSTLWLYETSLFFHCPNCGVQYTLPVRVMAPRP